MLRRRDPVSKRRSAAAVVALCLFSLGPPALAVAESSELPGRTFHVSSARGSDSDTGLAPDHAWRSLRRAVAHDLRAGDRVLLHRGGIWRENLKPRQSGTAARPIIFGAYGAGDRPRIFGSESRTGSTWWTESAPATWYTDGIPVDPGMLFHDDVGSQRVESASALRETWDWSYDAARGRLYVRLDANPGLHTIEVPQRDGIGFSSANHLRVEAIEIAYARMGIGIWGGRGWTIQDVDIHDVTVNGVQGNRGARGITVRDSIFRDWAWRSHEAPASAPESVFGYGIQVISSPRGSPPSDGWIIVGNRLSLVNLRNAGADATAINVDQGGHAARIADNAIIGNRRAGGGGIMVWRPRGIAPVEIARNTIRDVGSMGINLSELGAYAFVAPVRIERNRILAVCALDLPDQEALRVWTDNGAPVVVTTNLVAGTPQGSNAHPGIRVRDSRQVALVSNTVHGTDIGIVIERNSVLTIVRNNLSAGSRQDAISVDPTSAMTEDHNLFQGAAIGFPPSPTTLLIDKEGCELGTIAGPAEWASDDALKLISAARGKS